jgi:Nif-specific regulatory protein
MDVPALIRALVRAGVNAPRPEGVDLHPFLVDGVERALIEEVMRTCGGTQVTAAKRLGINRNTLHKKWEQYKIDDRGPSARAPDDDAPPAEAAAAG